MTLPSNYRTGGDSGLWNNDPDSAKAEQIRVIQSEYDNPQYARGKPALARELARLGITVPPDAAPGAQLVGALGSPEVNAVIAKSDQARGALSSVPLPKPSEDLGYDSGPATPTGALSVLPQQRQPFNLQAMIDQFAPKDDSASKYFAIAAALGKPTGFGTLGEKFGNIAQALNDQKANQERLRSQYVPIIMQQVAAQQARDEQAAYKAEAAAQAQQAAAALQKERLVSTQQAQQERLAQQAQLAQQHEALMRTLAGNKEPAPAQIITTSAGIFERTRDGQLKPLTDAAGKQLYDKDSGGGGQGTLAGTAPVLGVPTPRVLPWANQSNPKDADKVKAQEMARGAKDVETDNDAARNEAATAQQMKQFMELNNRVPTGELVDKVPGGQWVQSFGKDYATMQSISSELIPKMRAPGSGSSSDLDVKMFARATIGVDKPKQTNDNIAQAVIQRAQNARDYADFRSTYLEQNGTLQGANAHWSKYLADNPIFDPAAAADFKLNPARQKWTEYFSGGKAAPKPITPMKNPDEGWDEPAVDVVGKHLGRK